MSQSHPTILDACALVLVGIKGIQTRSARLTYAMARHMAVDLAQAIGGPPPNGKADRLPPDDLTRLRALLKDNGLEPAEGAEADAKLHELRREYEPYLNSLSDKLFMPLPAWLPEDGARDNWQRTAHRVAED